MADPLSQFADEVDDIEQYLNDDLQPKDVDPNPKPDTDDNKEAPAKHLSENIDSDSDEDLFKAGEETQPKLHIDSGESPTDTVSLHKSKWGFNASEY